MSIVDRLRQNCWAAREALDIRNWRALKGRLNLDEQKSGRIELRLRSLEFPLLARPASSDIPAIWEIFYGREYRPNVRWCFSTVLDRGANVGYFAAYSRASAGAQLRSYVGVEPDPDAFKLLEDQVKLHRPGQFISLQQVAVSDQDGIARFSRQGESWAHRLAGDGSLEVPTLTISSLLDSVSLAEVDLVKLDIEGAEKSVLESLPAWGHRAKCIVAELHATDAPLDCAWFASVTRAAGFTPMPAGTLFHGQPAAVRNGLLDSFLMTSPPTR
jgi:FkbM family methyltransferase